MAKVIKVIIQIALLYGMYMLGMWIQQFFNLFVPGSVIGLVLMFLLLMTGVVKVRLIEDGARFMINNLVLFFIPVTVGAMNYYQLLAGKGLLLIAITLISTVFVMAFSGITTQFLHKRGLRQ